MTPALKIGLGAITTATAIGSSAGIAFFVSQPKNLKEDLEKGQHKLLDTKADNDAWKDLVEKYKKEPQTAGIERINGLAITDPVPPKTEPHPGIKLLRDECEKLFKKTKKDKGYAQFKKDAENWCTRKNVSETVK